MAAHKSQTLQVLFRVDASLTIGAGHLMRCLTLAHAMRLLGWHVTFCCREHPGHLIALIEHQGFICHRLPLLYPASATAGVPPAPAISERAQEGDLCWLGATEEEDAAGVLQLLQRQHLRPDLMVIDHYGLGFVFETALVTQCRHLLVIDDLANRAHCCDFLLDQNLLPDAQHRYQDLLPDYCQQFIGPSFALLRPEFVSASDTNSQSDVVQPILKQRNFTQQPFQLLVFFGGSDIDNLTALAITALQQLQNSHWLADIVIGSANPHLRLLQQLCEEDSRLTLHVQTPGMAKLMAKAQLMIGGGGATHWERCAMALPAIVVSLAANQQRTSAYLAELGACVYLGAASTVSGDDLHREIAVLLSQPQTLQRMSQAAAKLVSAEGGCQRLLDAISQKVQARAH